LKLASLVVVSFWVGVFASLGCGTLSQEDYDRPDNDASADTSRDSRDGEDQDSGDADLVDSGVDVTDVADAIDAARLDADDSVDSSSPDGGVCRPGRQTCPCDGSPPVRCCEEAGSESYFVCEIVRLDDDGEPVQEWVENRVTCDPSYWQDGAGQCPWMR